MKRFICTLLPLLCFLLLTACSDKSRSLSGEVSDVRAENGEIVSFVLTDADGKRTGVLVPEDAHFTSRTDLDPDAEKDLLLSGRPGTSVRVEYNGGKTKLTTDSGEKLPAYTAWFVAVDGYLEPDAAALQDGTPLDLRQGALLEERLGDPFLKGTRGYDHNFVLDGGMAPAAEVYCPATGIALEVCTTLEGMQFYTSGFLTDRPGKGGAQYGRAGGLCLETQHFPDAVNQPSFPSPILRAGEEYRETTSWRFFLKK